MRGFNLVIIYGKVISEPSFSGERELSFRLITQLPDTGKENFKIICSADILEEVIAKIYVGCWLIIEGKLVTNIKEKLDREPYILLNYFEVTTSLFDFDLGIELPRIEKFNDCFD